MVPFIVSCGLLNDNQEIIVCRKLSEFCRCMHTFQLNLNMSGIFNEIHAFLFMSLII